MATMRLSRLCLALKTSPMPPLAISLSNSNSPISRSTEWVAIPCGSGPASVGLSAPIARPGQAGQMLHAIFVREERDQAIRQMPVSVEKFSSVGRRTGLEIRGDDRVQPPLTLRRRRTPAGCSARMRPYAARHSPLTHFWVFCSSPRKLSASLA